MEAVKMILIHIIVLVIALSTEEALLVALSHLMDKNA
jgi:hypothetical protein